MGGGAIDGRRCRSNWCQHNVPVVQIVKFPCSVRSTQQGSRPVVKKGVADPGGHLRSLGSSGPPALAVGLCQLHQSGDRVLPDWGQRYCGVQRLFENQEDLERGRSRVVEVAP